MAAIDEVLSKAQLSADERKLLDNILAKNKDLRDGWERQGEFSKKLNEVNARKKEYDDAVEYNVRMKAWADEKLPLWEQAQAAGVIDEDGRPAWRDKQAGYEKEIADLKAQSVGGDVDPVELQKRVTAIVKEAGALTREEIQAVANAEARKMTEEVVNSRFATMERDFNTKTIPYLGGFAAQLSTSAHKYERETGKEWDEEAENEFAKFMNKEEDYKPRSAMEKFLKPIREKKVAEADLEKRAEARAQEIIRQRGGMPGSGGEPYIPQDDNATSMGSLKMMLKQSESEPMDVESMAAIAAQAAAKELRAEGKGW